MDERIIQVGKVHSIDESNLRAKVSFNDGELISDWLSIVQRTDEEVEVIVEETNLHTHEAKAKVIKWLPKVGDTVLVIYLPLFNSDGFIIGCIK